MADTTLTIIQSAPEASVEVAVQPADQLNVTIEQGARGDRGLGESLPISSDDVDVPEQGDLTTVLTGLGTYTAAVDGRLITAEAALALAEDDIDGLTLDVAALEGRADDLELLNGRAEELTYAEAAERTATLPLFALCAPAQGGDHHDYAWQHDPPGDYTTGAYARFDDLVVLPYPDVAPSPTTERTYSELATQTHDEATTTPPADPGIWDNEEDAVERKWSTTNLTWEEYLYYEWTEIGGTIEAHTASTEGVFRLVRGAAYSIVRWLEFNVAGNWRLRWFRRVWHETPTHQFDDANWVLIHTVNGTGTTSIDTGVTDKWGYGYGQGRVHCRKITKRDAGPTGTLLAEVDAQDAFDAGDLSFTDGAGNTVTPGTEASTFDPTAVGLELGETSTTAYRGDRGKTAYDHSQLTTGNPHNVTAAQVGAPPTSRLITAGTGLTGGGDLSADRTLAVTYGLAASTAAEGIAIQNTTWRSGSFYGPTAPRVANAGQTLASGEARAMPFYNPVAGRTIDQLAVDVQSGATSTGVLYICTDDGTGYPGAVVASAALSTFTTSTRSAATVSGSTYVLPRGLLWLVAHGTGTSWSGLTLDGQSPLMPIAASYSTGGISCWRVTGAGTSTFTSFPAGGSLSTGVMVSMRAA